MTEDDARDRGQLKAEEQEDLVKTLHHGYKSINLGFFVFLFFAAGFAFLSSFVDLALGR